jgi:hypothetical protein
MSHLDWEAEDSCAEILGWSPYSMEGAPWAVRVALARTQLGSLRAGVPVGFLSRETEF